MRSDRRRRRPQLEALEGLTLLSPLAVGTREASRGMVASGHHAKASRALEGTLHGTFFAHRGSPSSGTVYSLFASGKTGAIGPTLLVGGFQRSGFAAGGVGGGNL